MSGNPEDDVAVLDQARAILRRHEHGIGASCTPVCFMTPEERAEHRAQVEERYAAAMQAMQEGDR